MRRREGRHRPRADTGEQVEERHDAQEDRHVGQARGQATQRVARGERAL